LIKVARQQLKASKRETHLKTSTNSSIGLIYAMKKIFIKSHKNKELLRKLRILIYLFEKLR
tara:strand:+ start:782 stop:964 length:183 start_codon:yes stop_codon:yes gene_type:complete